MKKFVIISLGVIAIVGGIGLFLSISIQINNTETKDENSPNTSSVANLLTAIAALATIIILIWQTRSSEKASNADFLLRLHNDFFFNDRNASIIRDIDNDNRILQINGGRFTAADLDDYLGIIELISLFIDKGSLTKDTVDSMFGYYIVKTWNNQEIQNYINNLRQHENNNEYYSGVEELANEFQNR